MYFTVISLFNCFFFFLTVGTTSNVIANEIIIDNLEDVQHNIDNETIESGPLENEVLPKSKIIIQPRKQIMTDFQKICG